MKSYSNPIIFLTFLMAFALTVLRATNWLTAIPGDLLDPRFNNVVLEHITRWIRGDAVELWSPSFFYPFNNLLALSDNHFGSVIFYTLFRTLEFSREESTTLWIAFGSLLNFLVSYWVLRKWSFSAFAAGAGAFVFSSSLPVLAWEEYSQLTYRFAIPLALYFFNNFIQRNNFYSIFWCIICVCEQLFCSIYLGYFLCFLLLAWMSAYIIISRDAFKWKKPYWPIQKINISHSILAIISILSLIACLAMFWKYHSVATLYQMQGWSKEKIMGLLPTLSSYFLADNSLISSFIGKQITSVPWRHPQQLFLGIGVSALFIAGQIILWLPKSSRPQLLAEKFISLGKISSLSLAILWLATIRIGDYSLYSLILNLPGTSAIQYVSRIILIMLWPIALTIAITCEYLWQKKSIPSLPIKGLLLPACLVILCSESFFYRVTFSPHSWWLDRLSTSELLIPKPLPSNAILHAKARIGEFESMSALDAMILSQNLQIPTFSGYSGNMPFGSAYTSRDSCHDIDDRLENYATYKNIPTSNILPLAKRALIIDADALQAAQDLNLAPSPLNIELGFNNRHIPNSALLICGWDLEHWGMWANHKIARMAIALPTEKTANLFIAATSAYASKTKPQHVDIYLNGQWTQQVMLGKNADNIISIPLSMSALYPASSSERPIKNLILEFRTLNPINPKKMNISDDNRNLGIGISSLQFK